MYVQREMKTPPPQRCEKVKICLCQGRVWVERVPTKPRSSFCPGDKGNYIRQQTLRVPFQCEAAWHNMSITAELLPNSAFSTRRCNDGADSTRQATVSQTMHRLVNTELTRGEQQICLICSTKIHAAHLMICVICSPRSQHTMNSGVLVKPSRPLFSERCSLSIPILFVHD
jgi:hypothetical protein